MAVRGCLIDIDGTLFEGDRVVPGAVKTLEVLRRKDLPFRLTTNTSRMSRKNLVARLTRMGIEVAQEELLTAPLAAAQWLRQNNLSRVMLQLPSAACVDFSDFDQSPERVEAVVVGDLGEEWTFERLNESFRALRTGAKLVAIHKNRHWNAGAGEQLDAGPFVVALEFAVGIEAILMGKPNPGFFEAAAATLGLPVEELLVIGDNPETDVAGGVACGCTAVAVRTGSFAVSGEQLLPKETAGVLDSIAQLPSFLGL
ncbi:MAG: TIGR01458 family HAD-type hydrolase [bacterium]|nr:TIGR01458 family HAD-type hydrolase [bacterium]